MMATRERLPMIPATLIPPPTGGGVPGPPGTTGNPGGGGNGPPGIGGIPSPDSCVVRGANGSGRPCSPFPTRAASALGFTSVEATLVGSGSPGAGAPWGACAGGPAFEGAVVPAAGAVPGDGGVPVPLGGVPVAGGAAGPQ